MVRSLCLAMCCAALALIVLPSDAYPRPNYYYRDENQIEQDEFRDFMRQWIEREKQLLKWKGEDYLPGEKRTLDLGLGRGYSGLIQAKHLIGLAAASDAGGPGKRR